MAQKPLDRTHLMEVPLFVRSNLDLQPLADAFGPSIHVHYSRFENEIYELRVGLSEFNEFPDPTIVLLCRAVCDLPKAARKLWDTASARTFDIGIDTAADSTYWFALTPSTLNTVAALGAQVVVTIYGLDSKNDEAKAEAIRSVRQADLKVS